MSEDPWDDWEAAADAGLSDLPTEKPKTKATTTFQSNLQLWDKANEYACPVIVHANTLAAHANYKPEMKILKRPQDVKNKQESTLTRPIKSLVEKEKDYEEAKRLIDEKFKKK
ncbi:hypothetical protein [Parasitella parasitica]|uniref:SUZ domain-containing protein n=1 Tax=Parasitella parasitica TaxID=35722 RepID=A0A0B7NGS8_9FUNG|nr:hypothetical protein [Parasitella parasitica]